MTDRATLSKNNIKAIDTVIYFFGRDDVKSLWELMKTEHAAGRQALAEIERVRKLEAAVRELATKSGYPANDTLIAKQLLQQIGLPLSEPQEN